MQIAVSRSFSTAKSFRTVLADRVRIVGIPHLTSTSNSSSCPSRLAYIMHFDRKNRSPGASTSVGLLGMTPISSGVEVVRDLTSAPRATVVVALHLLVQHMLELSVLLLSGLHRSRVRSSQVRARWSFRDERLSFRTATHLRSS